ncbi:MAG: hypothetical protein J6A91_00390 [Bacteroidales bacterium]|nr:hypothetical protein [Bacteroidales bacterium]
MKRIITTIAIFFCFCTLVGAQTDITRETLVAEGDSVKVSFSVDSERGVPKRRKEVIMPYIYNGRDTLFFDVLEVYGKGRFKRERQEKHIAGDRDWELGDNQILRGSVYEYASSVPLKRWMKSATLGIRRQLVGCACEKDLLDEDVLNDSVFQEPPLPPRRIPEYALCDASREWDFGHDELEIIFKVSRIEIDSSVFNNEVTFGKILDAVDRIFSNPFMKLDKIEVAGYASPEGPPDFNTWLGENRAKALIDYIIKHRPQYDLTTDHFRIRNGEENWEGLRRVVAASDMKRKEQVLEIIDNDTIPDERRKIWIERIDNGWVWRRMLDEIYPHLRCARYLAIYYDSSDDHAVEIINGANAMIREGNHAQAYEALQGVREDMRAFNSIGVALMLQGRFEEAMPWFERAVSEMESAQAEQNMAAIKREYEYETQQREEREAYLKKYE